MEPAQTSAKGLAESAENLEKATGGKCLAAAADVRDPAALKEAVEATLKKFGKIDFVICGGSRDLKTRQSTIEGCVLTNRRCGQLVRCPPPTKPFR